MILNTSRMICPLIKVVSLRIQADLRDLKRENKEMTLSEWRGVSLRISTTYLILISAILLMEISCLFLPRQSANKGDDEESREILTLFQEDGEELEEASRDKKLSKLMKNMKLWMAAKNLTLKIIILLILSHFHHEWPRETHHSRLIYQIL